MLILESFIRALEGNDDRTFNYVGDRTPETIQLAALYTFADKQFSGVALQKKTDELKAGIKSLRIFSAAPIDQLLAAHIYLSSEQEKLIEALGVNFQKLVEVGFKKVQLTLTASLFLSEDDAHSSRTMQLYMEMKKYHPFLTGKNDVPLAVLLTKNQDSNPVVMAKTMHTYYNELKSNFSPGEALQMLSQLLTIYDEQYNENLVPYVIQIKKELEKRKIKIKRMHYPFIAILALNESNVTCIEEVGNLYEQLIRLKMFSVHKEIALQIAIQKVVMKLQQETLASTVGQMPKYLILLEIAPILFQIPRELTEVILGNIPFLD